MTSTVDSAAGAALRRRFDRTNAEYEQLLATARQLRAEDSDVSDIADDGSRASEHEQEDLLLGNLRRQLDQLEAALERLQQGKYGVCDVCGQRISAGRLKALPAATTCVSCQQAQERR